MGVIRGGLGLGLALAMPLLLLLLLGAADACTQIPEATELCQHRSTCTSNGTGFIPAHA